MLCSLETSYEAKMTQGCFLETEISVIISSGNGMLVETRWENDPKASKIRNDCDLSQN